MFSGGLISDLSNQAMTSIKPAEQKSHVKSRLYNSMSFSMATIQFVGKFASTNGNMSNIS